MLARPPLPALLLAPLALAGCAASSTSYPSLGLRAVEATSLAEPARPAPATATPAAVADARFADLVAQARAGDRSFRELLAVARPAIALGRAAPAGSDAWGAAQQQRSRLEAARGPVGRALVALQAAGETEEAATDSGVAAAAARALAAVAALDAAEEDALRSLAMP